VASRQASLDGFDDKPDGAPKNWDDDKTRAQALLDAGNGALDDVIARAITLKGEVDESARTTISALESAKDVAPDEPGLWDRITDAIGDIGEFLGDVVEFVKDNWWNLLHQLVSICATVLAVASLFCPALAPFALAFAAADVLMSGIDWARGVPGAKEAFLTGAVGLIGGFAVGKLAAQFMKVAGPALARGPSTVVAQGGGGGAIAAPLAAALSFNPRFGPALAGYVVLKAKDAKDGADAITSLLGGNTYYSQSLADGWRRARNS
jgi:hypothetical protein